MVRHRVAQIQASQAAQAGHQHRDQHDVLPVSLSLDVHRGRSPRDVDDPARRARGGAVGRRLLPPIAARSRRRTGGGSVHALERLHVAAGRRKLPQCHHRRRQIGQGEQRPDLPMGQHRQSRRWRRPGAPARRRQERSRGRSRRIGWRMRITCTARAGADRRRNLRFALATMLALSLGQLPSRAGAQGTQIADYPARKVTFIVGFAPGGGVDTMARIVAQELTEQLGYQIVIENRPGAASNIAAKAVASAAPDGYTFLFTGNSLAINQTFYKNLNYSIDELRAVAIAASDSQALAINAGLPVRTLA